MTTMPILSTDTSSHVTPAAALVTTLDGSVIVGTISGITAHQWSADANGLFHTATNLAAEWADTYTKMLHGLAGTLTPLQRLEGNAEAVVENTAAKSLPAAKLAAFREDAQREFDAIDAAMRIDQAAYGIDPAKAFNIYTYLRLEHTLQGNEQLDELAIQGHGVNHAPAAKYDGFTETFQNHTDNKTYYVGGGPGTGEKAIAAFFDDDVLTHASFAAVMHNGAWDQLNQNGDIENSLTDAIAAANAVTYNRVFVASDFSTDPTATGAVVLVPGAQAAPALPVAGAGQEVTLDGSVIATTLTTAGHVWVADASGLFHTATNLTAEWAADYKLAQSGAALTPLQRWEANAEAVAENTGVAKLSHAKQEAFREDAQREFDAVWTSMQINARTLGISATAAFTTHSYLMMEHTLQNDEALEQLAVQGHGLNKPPSAEYAGFTSTFQNRTDNSTLYNGGGPDNGEKAIAAYFDDIIITHASFPTVLHNGVLTQINQNGTREDKLSVVIPAANATLFTQTLGRMAFAHPSTATVKPAAKG